jgi:outer membrane protein
MHLLLNSSSTLGDLKRVPLACFMAMGLMMPAFAVVDAPVREAMEAINAKQPKKAFDMLSPLEATRAGDPDFDAALGIAANEVGEFSRAIFALERVLVAQPGNARARAELARALFAVRDTANARKLLQEVKQDNLPEGVNQTIDEFLQAIDKVDEQGRSSLKVFAETGLGHDSNVNSGPAQNSFAVPVLGNAVVTLLPAGQKASASYLHFGAGVSGRAVITPRVSFIGSINAALRRHGNNASAFNINQIDGNAGLSYREERHEFAGVLNLSQSDIGGATVRRISGVTGEWTYRPDGKRQWVSYIQLSNLDYPGQPVRDAKRSVLGTSYAFATDGGSVIYGGGYFGREKINNAAFPHLGQNLTGLRAGIQMPFTPQWSFFATAAHENRRYGGADPLFLIARRDNQFDVTVGAHWKFTENIKITPQLSITRADSNIVVNEYNKTSFSVVARYEF